MFRLSSLLAAAFCALPAPAAANLLLNGGFEAGDLSGWTRSGNPDFTTVLCSPEAQVGDCYLQVGPEGYDGVLSQALDTDAGDLLTISGWIWGNRTPFSHVVFLLNGVEVFNTGDGVADGWNQHVVTAAAQGDDVFSVAFRNDLSFSHLDELSVVATPGVVPEPAAWALLIAGFGGMGVALRRRRAPA